MTEIFVPIRDYEGLYEIGNFGTVKSLSKYRGTCYSVHSPEKVKKPNSNGNYLITALSKNAVKKTFIIHRLVASHFIPNPDNLPEVNHIDGNKMNIAASNLEWTTRAGNEKHAYETGLKRGGSMWGNSKPVSQFTLDKVFIKQWDCLSDISRSLGFHRRVISDCCKGKTKSSHGFIWAFK